MHSAQIVRGYSIISVSFQNMEVQGGILDRHPYHKPLRLQLSPIGSESAVGQL